MTRHGVKCPRCQHYSLTYELLRNVFICHTYNAVIPAEDMPPAVADRSATRRVGARVLDGHPVDRAV